MRSVGVVCPVWQESRYLPLILEQMSLCPGPKIVLWQDQPLHWMAEDRSAPSGFASKVKDILPLFPSIEVIKMDHAPVRTAYGADDAEYGGFTSLTRMGLQLLRERGVDVLVWADSDWILELSEMQRLVETLAVSDPSTTLHQIGGHNYWRDFKHSEGQRELDIGIAYNTRLASIFDVACADPNRVKLDILCHHPGWVLSEEEIFNKLHSWGHAPYYKARGFYENEWLKKDDSRIGVFDVDWEIPAEIVDRLTKWDCLEPGWL